MSGRWTRVAALSGVLFVILGVASALVPGNTPDTDASGQAVQAFYIAHKGRQNAGALFTVLAVIFGLFFFAYLRAYFRRIAGTEWLASLSFGGAILFGASGAVAAGTTFALTDTPRSLAPAALQALNVIQSDLFFPLMAAGLAVFYFAVMFCIFKTRALPIGLAWVSLVIGLACASVVLSFFAFLATGLWALYVSIYLAVKNPTIAPDALTPVEAPRVAVPV